MAVVLAATPAAAGADGGLPPLLPEAADEAGIEAIDAPVSGEGSGVGGVPAEVVPAEVVPAEAVPAEPAAEDTHAGDTHAGDTHAGDTHAGDTRAGDEEREAKPNTPGLGDMGRAEVSPEPASRLLRALAELPVPETLVPETLVPETLVPETLVSEHGAPDDGAAGAALVHAVDGCPRALLRRLLAGAADEGGALTALGIEREVLTLCRGRQEIVAGLFETEARLRELRGESAAGAPALSPAPAVVQVAKQPEVQESVPPRLVQPSPVQAALTAAPEGLESPEETGADYGWFSIIGTAGALRAGVTDGTGVWFVREGDALPDGSAVIAIAARPPAVRIAGADGEMPLSWQARPEAGP
ncbi:MAG: hypothetical protein OXN81_11395 [Alphaproteobacteria bacterium]|nr:hypothetical protein [Alphaproteobacteria bacterium]